MHIQKKSMWVIIQIVTHATLDDPLICSDDLVDGKAKTCNYWKSYKFLVWSYLSFQLFNSQPYSTEQKVLNSIFFFRSVNNQTKCPVIQTFNRTKPIFDWTLSIDRPLFQALHLSNLIKLMTAIGDQFNNNKKCL